MIGPEIRSTSQPAWNGDRPSWLSAHLFFSGPIYGLECDDILLNCIAAFVAGATESGLLARWFFVRYREHGSHVRLRLFPTSVVVATALRHQLAAGVLAHNPSVHFDEFPAVLSTPNAAATVTHLCWVPYQPEYQRYGYGEAMDVAETFFHASSGVAMDVIHATRGNKRARLGRGLLMMLALTHAFMPTRSAAKRFATSYCKQYLRYLAAWREPGRLMQEFRARLDAERSAVSDYVDAAWHSLDHNEPLPDGLARIHRAATRAHDHLTAELDDCQNSPGNLVRAVTIPQIVASYAHMTNNRCGISMHEEAYLAFLLSEVIAVPGESRAGLLDTD